MNISINLSETAIEAQDADALRGLCGDLRQILGENLISLTLYGSAVRKDYRPGKSNVNLLVVVDHIDLPVLRSVLDAVFRGRRFGIVPFFLTQEDLQRSADVFPVKFISMRENYQVLAGGDVLADLNIAREHLRLRCEQEIKNILLRLRRHYLMSGGRRLTQVLSGMTVGFLESLRMLHSLIHGTLPSREEVIESAAKTFGIDPEVLINVSTLRELDVALPREEEEELYALFMETVQKAARIADKL
ncbi:MAG: hypothetical protein R2941_18175 [Desulfobacterales bacterium]